MFPILIIFVVLFVYIIYHFINFKIYSNSSYYENLVNQTQDIYKQSHLYDINEKCIDNKLVKNIYS